MIKQCKLEECDKPHHCKGFCRTHYLRWYRHGDPLIVLARAGNRTPRPSPAKRTCRHCKQVGPSSDFKKQANTCKKCGAERLKQWKTANPEKVFESNEKRKKTLEYRLYEVRRRATNLGLDPDEVVAYYLAHDGRCEICDNPPRDGGRDLNIDHDHGTGAFRGLLCDNCNNGLGRFKDNIANLEGAITYLKRHGRGEAS